MTRESKHPSEFAALSEASRTGVESASFPYHGFYHSPQSDELQCMIVIILASVNSIGFEK